jgi:hypothetical protein
MFGLAVAYLRRPRVEATQPRPVRHSCPMVLRSHAKRKR